MHNIATVPETSTADIYFMSSRARNKLARESYKPELNLRKLVAHANLMDSLYDELEYRRAKYHVTSTSEQTSHVTQKHVTQTTTPEKHVTPPKQTHVTFVTPVTPVAPVTTLSDIPEYISSDEETESETESEDEEMDLSDSGYSLTVDNSVHIVGEPVTQVLSDSASFATHHKIDSSENLSLEEQPVLAY